MTIVYKRSKSNPTQDTLPFFSKYIQTFHNLGNFRDGQDGGFGGGRVQLYLRGGFVELSVLLKDSSPLRSRTSKAEAKNWMMSKAGPRLVVVKDFNGEISCWCAN